MVIQSKKIVALPMSPGDVEKLVKAAKEVVARLRRERDGAKDQLAVAEQGMKKATAHYQRLASQWQSLETKVDEWRDSKNLPLETTNVQSLALSELIAQKKEELAKIRQDVAMAQKNADALLDSLFEDQSQQFKRLQREHEKAVEKKKIEFEKQAEVLRVEREEFYGKLDKIRAEVDEKIQEKADLTKEIEELKRAAEAYEGKASDSYSKAKKLAKDRSEVNAVKQDAESIEERTKNFAIRVQALLGSSPSTTSPHRRSVSFVRTQSSMGEGIEDNLHIIGKGILALETEKKDREERAKAKLQKRQTALPSPVASTSRLKSIVNKKLAPTLNLHRKVSEYVHNKLVGDLREVGDQISAGKFDRAKFKERFEKGELNAEGLRCGEFTDEYQAEFFHAAHKLAAEIKRDVERRRVEDFQLMSWFKDVTQQTPEDFLAMIVSQPTQGEVTASNPPTTPAKQEPSTPLAGLTGTPILGTMPDPLPTSTPVSVSKEPRPSVEKLPRRASHQPRPSITSACLQEIDNYRAKIKENPSKVSGHELQEMMDKLYDAKSQKLIGDERFRLIAVEFQNLAGSLPETVYRELFGSPEQVASPSLDPLPLVSSEGPGPLGRPRKGSATT